MTNRLALILLLLVAALVALDHFVLHLGLVLALARQFVHFVEYVSFWR